jgi:methyl-accepting chemotaxis protein
MKPFSVKKQLSLAFGALAALVALVSLLGVRGMTDANGRFETYVNGVDSREGLAIVIRSGANRRAIGVRDMVLAKSDADIKSAQAAATKAHEALHKGLDELKEALAKSQADARERELFDAVERIEARYAPVALDILKLAADGKREEAIDRMNTDCRPLLAQLIDATKAYMAYVGEGMARESAESEAAVAAQRRVLVGIAIGAVLAALALGWLITRRIVHALGAEPATLGEAARQVALGDLRPVAGADAAGAGSVLASMGTMQQQLVHLIGQVRNSAESIATASAQIAQGNMDLSSRTEEQASALEETAASMEQLGATVRQNANNAREADRLAQDASSVALRGGEVVTQVVATMKDIEDSSRRIADIIGVIDGIAFQTNILALNAAVEAARAGEQGRGFAVVASEVRSLAGRSADAAREIKTLIGASVERVERGTALVDRAGATMGEVVGAIRQVSSVVGEISTASNEQSAGVSQVGEAVSQMDRATQQNAALVEESAAAAESMKTQARQLVEAVAQFRLARG